MGCPRFMTSGSNSLSDSVRRGMIFYTLPNDKFEGIAVDMADNRLYLVNDRKNSFFVVQLPG
ncbi:hypothetical protein BH23BAC3_BH23BAC3_30600 [soil metagenome]